MSDPTINPPPEPTNQPIEPVEIQIQPVDSQQEPPEKKSLMGRLLTLIKWGTICFGMGLLLSFSVLVYLYYSHVVWAPAPHIQQDEIQKIIAQESPIYYRNSTVKIGSLFDSKHRIYVPESDLPSDWIAAITAAEDQRFFSHGGLDYKGIVRAMIQNLQAGRIVSGGSTLTQQTAKNLYYRRDRTLKAKLNEAVNAFRLERLYSKGKILEFYSNQFHVNANGRGLGIAARYFFDKDVSELTTIECAFIAGMVKGPRNYNPFIGKSQERRQAALKKAHIRTQYVLDRMKDTGALDAEMHNELTAVVEAEAIPFQKGQFQFDSNLLADEVAKRLQEEPFKSIFDKAEIVNPSTAGLKITTTIDRRTQRVAQYGMLHHLTEIGSHLEGLDINDLFSARGSLRKLPFESGEKPEINTFHFGRLIEKQEDALTFDLNGQVCVVDKSGLKRLAKIAATAKKGRPRKGKIKTILDEADIGDISWLSIRDNGVCDIEVDTKLQGAILAAQEGQIIAMVGGRENKDYNRALDAERQLGSVWKTLIYAAALQLGWTPLDLLDNDHNAFPFENFWYYPRAAHKAPRAISLSWAGVHSENRASVWLFYHLTDRLSIRELSDLAQTVGLGPRSDESRKDYIKRIRDKYGVISTHKRDEENAFMRAKRKLLENMDAGDEALALRSLLYGRGASRQIRKARNAHNKRAAAFNLLSLRKRSDPCIAAHAELLDYIELKQKKEASPFGFDFQFTPMPALTRIPEANPPSEQVLKQFWLDQDRLGCGQNQKEGGEPLTLTDLDQMQELPPLHLDGVFQVKTLLELEQIILKNVEANSIADPYSLAYLIHHPDFQFLIHVQYLSQLLRQFGLKGDLPPRQSLPLGAVELSLDEAATLYGGILSGKWIASDAQNGRRLQLIDKIVYTQHAEEGEHSEEIVLYQRPSLMEPVSGVEVGWMTADILHNVVNHGTARRGKGKVNIGGVEVPILGKTGTTNDFRNAAFCGIAPAFVDGSWSLNKGITIASYVGYDNNSKMKHGRIRIAGASGALPLWLKTAQGAADSGLLGAPEPDSKWQPAVDLHGRRVDAKTGNTDSNGAASIWFYSQSDVWGGDPEPQRLFTPVQPNVTPVITLLKPNESIEADTGGEVKIQAKKRFENDEEIPDAVLDTGQQKPQHRIIPDRRRGESGDNAIENEEGALFDGP